MVPRPFTPERSMRSRSCADVIQRCQGCLSSATREITGREPGDDVDCSSVIKVYFAFEKKHERLYLRQIVEVKKLTKFFSQFSLGNYSIRHEFQALLFNLGKEKTRELMYSRNTETGVRKKFCEEMKQYL